MAKPIKITIVGDASKLKRALDDAEGKLGRFSSKVGKVGKAAAGAFAGVGLAAGAAISLGITEAISLEAATDKLAAQIGGPLGEDLGKVAGDLYANGFGDSVAEAGDTLRRIWQNGLIAEDASNEAFEALATKFMTFTDVMEQDMDMTTQAVQSMIKSGIADSAEEALDVMTRGIQQGADKAGDLAETFQEYGTSFREAGLTAADAAGLMVQGLKAGARDADKVADAIKEFGIRAQDASTTSADGFARIGLNAQEMTRRMAEGGEGAADVLDQVLDGLRAMEDPVERNAAAVELFGTQAEDLGDALFALDLDTAAAGMGNIEGATDKLGSAYDNAAQRIEVFKRQALMKLTEFVGNEVIPRLEQLYEWAGPKMAAAWEWAQPHVERLRDMLVEFGERAIPVIKDVIDTVTSFVDRIIGARDETEGNVGKINGIISKFGEIFVATFDLVRAAIDFVKEAARIFWDIFGEHITNFAENVLPIFLDAINGLLDVVLGVIETITALLRGDWSEAWEGAKRTVGGAVDVIKGILGILWNLLTLGFNLAKAAITRIWSEAWDRIKDGVSSGISRVGEEVGKLPGRILSALGDLGRLLWNAGRDIVQGMIDGIASKAASLRRTISNLGRTSVGKVFNRSLKISSPSKVMMESGREIVRGLEIGIGQRTRTLENQVSGLQGIFDMGPSGAAALGATGSGPTVIVNATTNADAHEIGSEVAWNLRGSGW